jgi:hypothetical protein
MKKQKILFFFGNGFSQGFGFPNMNGLWEICLKSSHKYYRNSLEEAKSRYPLSYFVTNDIRDIELLLTAWKAYYKSHETYVSNSNAHVSGRGCFEDYVENMCNWLHSYTLKSARLEIFNEFREWLKDAVAKYEIIFITTNYDLLLEKVLLDNSLKYHYIEAEEMDSVPIRKLHGSISWFSSSQAILREYNSFRYKSFFEGKSKNLYVYEFSHYCLSFQNLAGMHMQWGSQLRSDNVVPIATLIPPTIGKEYNELFGSIVHFMEQDFRNFDYFVMIGYSFPDADPVVKDIIINFYNKCKSEKSKIVCINDNEDACNKINRLFGDKVESIGEKWNAYHLRNLFL